MTETFQITPGPGPLVAAAVHDGHAVRPETMPHFALGHAGRLREEDPFTGALAEVAPARIVGLHSRFEVDLNRPRDRAVYRTPEDAWGLEVWKDDLPESIVRQSLVDYDAFYAAVRALLAEKVDEFGSVVVFDLHSYNHRRDGADGPLADPEKNPEVNVGTGSLDRGRWGPLVDRFMADLRTGGGDRQPDLDVRENVKFEGGHFSQWVHETFGNAACVLAVEFKKTFMDEWTGDPDPAHLRRLAEALAATVPGVLAEREAATS